MGSVLSDLVPVIIGAAVVPAWIIIVLFALRSESGLSKALAIVGGATVVRLAQGILFGYVFGSSGEASSGGGPGPIASTLLTVVGILLLVTAVKYWRKEDDPDAPPPKWMASIGGMAPLTAFGVGALFTAISVKRWTFTLLAISIVEEAALGQAQSLAAFLIYLVGTELLALIPIGAYALAPQQSAGALEGAASWLQSNNRVITITVSTLFGVFFLWKGISGLLG